MKFIQLDQGTQEWLDFRKGKIGSSMAGSIMGVGFKTPLQLFEDIIEDKSTPPSHAMRRGTEMEPFARDWVERHLGVKLNPVVVQHAHHDWHISSLDGFGHDEKGNPVAVEIKCPGVIDHTAALNGQVPQKYIPQCLHILEDLPGVEKILYCSYHDEASVATIWVHRDEEKMKYQLEQEHNFYLRLVNYDPPPPMDKDWIEILGSDANILAQEYQIVTHKISELQNQADDIKKWLIEKLAGCKRAKIGDLKAQKIVRQGCIDYSKIDVLKGLDLNPYRKSPITSWRLN